MIRETVYEVLLLTKMELFYWRISWKAYIVGFIVTPLAFLMYSRMYVQEKLPGLLIGILLYAVLFSGLNGTTNGFLRYRDSGLISLVKTRPLSMFSVSMSLSLAALVNAIPSLAFFILVGLFGQQLKVNSLWIILPLLILILLVFSLSLGVIVFAKSGFSQNIGTITSVIGFALIGIPPIFYSISLLPPIVQPFVYIFPTLHFWLLLSYIFGVQSEISINPLTSVLYLIITTGITSTLAFKWLNWEIY